MLVLVTDFGLSGPYTGQMKAVLYREAPGVPVVNLFSDAPTCNPRASAYLLAAYAMEFPAGSVFLAVIDPGVGTESRRPVVLEAEGRWFVGPDNGLFSIVARRAQGARWWEITWRPQHLSMSFHGRDLFAPVAAMLARGEGPPGIVVAAPPTDWPDDLPEIIYIDHFGNALTGMRADRLTSTDLIRIGSQVLAYAPTFGAVEQGTAFWYRNANDLVELAVNQGSAAIQLGADIGDTITVVGHA